MGTYCNPGYLVGDGLFLVILHLTEEPVLLILRCPLLVDIRHSKTLFGHVLDKGRSVRKQDCLGDEIISRPLLVQLQGFHKTYIGNCISGTTAGETNQNDVQTLPAQGP